MVTQNTYISTLQNIYISTSFPNTQGLSFFSCINIITTKVSAMQLITLNNQMEIPSHPTTPPMKFPAPKKLDARKKSRTYSSGKNRDVFRSPRSTQFDENTEHMLTLRRCSRVPIIEPDNFSRDLYLVFDDMDDNNQFENKVAIGNELHLHRSIQLPMRKSESLP